MKRLLSYIKDYKFKAILAPLFKCLEACFELFVPLVISSMIDVGIRTQDYGYVLRMGLLLLLLALIGLCCSVTAQYFSAKVAIHTGKEMRADLFRHITSLGYQEIDTLGTSTLITRMTSDINQIESGVNLTLRLFMRSPFIVFGAMVMAFTINVKAALIFCVTIPLLAVVVFGIMLSTMPMYRNVQKQLDRVMKTTRENLLGVRVVRAFNRQASEKEEFKAENDLLTKMQVSVGRISALLNPVTYVIINLSVVALVLAGGRLVNTGILSQGKVVALVNYMNQILVELIKLANLGIQISKAYACLNRVNGIFDEKSAIVNGAEKQPKHTAVPFLSFAHVDFRYSEGGAPALSDVSFEVQKGETIGVIGGTGSGKSTLMNLLPRFYDVSAGSISLYGTDLRDYDVETLRQRFGVVPQKSVLFSGSIRENMQWGRRDAEDADIYAALRTAQAYDFVKEKGEGLDFMIEQEGRNLSGGQKQRLCIARALVRKPEVLILDDSASALDFATDAALRRAIREDTENTTVFLVSQRVATVRGAARIIVLDEGRVVGIGTHRELFDTCSVYHEICMSQLSQAEAER